MVNTKSRKIFALKSLFIFILTFTFFTSSAQLNHNTTFTKADSLRGSTTSPLRNCYDINYYHLNIKIDPEDKSLEGYNEFQFTASQDFKVLQFDLFDNLNIDKIVYKNKKLPYKREYNAVFVSFPKNIKKGTKDSFKVYYSGKPIVAKNAPWDGGFVFSQDKDGNPVIATAAQGLGASSWWPNKDQQADEPDSMLISVSVPKNLRNVSNGRLRSVKKIGKDYKQYNWFVAKPINNYGVSINIANYVHLQDTFKGKNGNLSLDYYVLPGHSSTAKNHFDADVKRMLEAFEYWFGPYPFYKDGYKLIETPFLGMEHQSAIAYGNKFKKGYQGLDLSGTGWGLNWDFIIVHESGHEWFGNNITSKDIADLWIHESFTSYSEALFTEYWYGKDAGTAYVIGLRKNILNDFPIIGTYGVNKEGSGDMYYKGANMLHTIRTIINDDKKWRSILTGLNTDFALQTVTTNDIVNYVNRKSGYDFTKVFDQYLRYISIPVLELKQSGESFSYRWNCDVRNFDMPLEIDMGNGIYQKVNASSEWKTVRARDFKIKEDYFVEIKKTF